MPLPPALPPAPLPPAPLPCLAPLSTAFLLQRAFGGGMVEGIDIGTGGVAP